MTARRQEAAWVLTEAAAEPYFNLVQRYVFAPYFAATLAANPGQGASVWGLALGSAGLAIALLAPVIGAIADSGSRLRNWLAGFAFLSVVAAGALWFAVPGAPLWPVAVVVALGIFAVELLGMFVNAFLPRVAPGHRVGALSAVGFGLSQVAGLAALLFVFTASGLAPRLFPDIPFATDRLAGPIAAVFILACIIPFLLLVREPPVARTASARAGLATLRATLLEAWRDSNMRRFLIGRMLAADGMAVVFGFGAVLAAASFGWDAGTMVVFGAIITVFGAVGGFFGGWLDPRLGSHRLMMLGLITLLLGTTSVILTDETRLLGIPTGVALGEPLASPQELGFLASGAVVALGAAFTLGAMRACMARLAPAAAVAAYFGLYAFVGKATAFVGPFLVSAIAAATGTVRLGIVVAVVFLVAGLALLAGVRVGREARQIAG
ncbi:MAG: MFS transporter [Thermaurantiacus sp.]